MVATAEFCVSIIEILFKRKKITPIWIIIYVLIYQ